MQSEVISYVESLNRDINFDNDTFALDIIQEVGPKGSYLEKTHTCKHFRKELWFPSLLNRDIYDAWRDKGGKSMEKRCQARKEEILASHEPQPLDDDVLRDLNRIVQDAKKILQKSD